MKFCPYCGADLVDSAVSFCSECGKALHDKKKEESPGKSETTEKEEKPSVESDRKKPKRSKPPKKKRSKKRRAKTKAKAVSELPETQDDGYDGYYDDILPVDEGCEREDMDKSLIKKVVLIIVGVLLVVAACVAIMYLL